MRILLLNKNPIISKLVRLSAQKLEYEFEERANYVDTLAQYDVIVIDDGVGANLKDLESKCKRLICISSKETNVQSSPKILHKPFLPTDLIALMRDDEKTQPQETQENENAAQESVPDDTPLDLDSLSFDSPTPENLTPQDPPEVDNNIYLQDIKEEDSAQESPHEEESNEDLASLNSPASIDDTLNATMPENENTTQDESYTSHFTFDENNAQMADLNTNLDFPSTDTTAQILENNADLPTLDEQTTASGDETPVDTATNTQTEQEKEDDGLSLEPIEFVETQLPTLETASQTQTINNTEQETDTTQNIIQDQTANIAEPIVDEVAQIEDVQDQQTNELTAPQETKHIEDQELEFDTKDIADIMGLDEQTIQNTPVEVPTKSLNTEEKTPENENTTDVLKGDDDKESAQAQTAREQEGVSEISSDEPASQENLSEAHDEEANTEQETEHIEDQAKPNAENEKLDENAHIQEEESEQPNEPTLDLDLENAHFLQPLNEKPFSIEEKKEGKISFDDLPEDAQFLGQNKEESVEADEIRPVLVDEVKAQSTQDMVKEQLAALDAMDNEANEAPAANSAILEDLQGVSERELQLALGEVPQDSVESKPAPQNDEKNAALKHVESQNLTPQNKINVQDSEVIDELSKGISGAIASSIKDDTLKAALKGMNMHIDINIKFDEDKA